MEINCNIIFDKISKEISNCYYKKEAEAITKILLKEFLHINIEDIIINKKFKTTQDKYTNLLNAVNRIKKYEPIQYIVGKADFFNFQFIVNKNTLIPRSETEELVNLIVKENNKENLKILDIGTGTGCIAITLNKSIKNSEVDAIDISEEALKIAKQNSKYLNSNVKFHKIDILNQQLPKKKWDIIVSNPPYVKISESKYMKQNVLNYEPKDAIFVSDKDPLIFYKRIAELSKHHLSANGKIYLEINENLGKETYEIFQSNSKIFQNIRLIKDLNNKDRFIKITF
ncbi:MAG: peptide chain release factor N(5)-glutamine methyltransferase [Bacteroidetes bacterium]|nr:peptide chain release factor N(5)-glutamine methyltransferase [Bacteroidota bacterium]